VADDAGVRRGRVEAGHARALATVFGEVRVGRLAYRAPGQANLHPAGGLLNLPTGKHSRRLRRLAAIESSRGSFEEAAQAIQRATGQRLGKRQAEQLARAAAADTDGFYAARRPGPAPASDLLVLSFDGKGIVMRPRCATRDDRAGRAGLRAQAGHPPVARGETRP